MVGGCLLEVIELFSLDGTSKQLLSVEVFTRTQSHPIQVVGTAISTTHVIDSILTPLPLEHAC